MKMTEAERLAASIGVVIANAIAFFLELASFQWILGFASGFIICYLIWGKSEEGKRIIGYKISGHEYPYDPSDVTIIREGK